MPRGARGGKNNWLFAEIGKCNSIEEIKRMIRKLDYETKDI